MAGGHLGFHKEQIGELTPEIYAEEVKEIIAVVRKYEEKYEKKSLSFWQEGFMSIQIMKEHLLLVQMECRLQPVL